jgi:hypothetical protein
VPILTIHCLKNFVRSDFLFFSDNFRLVHVAYDGRRVCLVRTVLVRKNNCGSVNFAYVIF